MLQFLLTKSFWLICFSWWTASRVLSQGLRDDGETWRTNENNLDSSHYFFYQQPSYPKDCSEVQNECSESYISDVYLIKPHGYPEPFEVYCHFGTDSLGWTAIQRRTVGHLDFNRNWTEYRNGFGFLSQEFWLGNDKLSFLTNQKSYELSIEVTDEDGISFNVSYSNFRISDGYSGYILTSVGDYNGIEENIDALICQGNNFQGGVVYKSYDCSRQCSCNAGHFTCADADRCSNNAVCEERNDLRQCYCKEGYIGDGIDCTDFTPTDCQEVYSRLSTENGVYKISPTTWNGDPFDVYCNMTDGGGWTVFQRRVNGTENFNLYWSDYKEGFGNPLHEFWLGNDKLHVFSTQRNYELRIDLVDRNGVPYYAKYNLFSISNEGNNYRLSLGSYTEGNAGNSLSYNDGHDFTTRDRDNDGYSVNCASEFACPGECGGEMYKGGWWYHRCTYVSLNDIYGACCFEWRQLPTNFYIKYTEMKLRPV